MSSIHRLFDIYEICALVSTFFTTGRDLYPLTLVNRQFHQSFNPLLWQECHIFLTSNDAPRPLHGRRYAPGRQKQQPTDHALARLGHLIRDFKLRIFEANVSTFILDLMRLHARQLVSVTIASAFMSTDDFKELVMGLVPMMIDFGALCRNDLADDCGHDGGDTFHPSTDGISPFDHGLLSHTITSLKLELEPSVAREILPAMIAARKQDDRVLAGLAHFRLGCQDLHSQVVEEVIKTKSLPLSMVHAFLDVFPKLETLCTSSMLIMEDQDPPLDEMLTRQGEMLFQRTSPRLQALTMTPHSPRVLSSLLARTITLSTIATIPRTIDAAALTAAFSESTTSTASGLRELLLTCYMGQPLLPTIAEYPLSNLEHFSYSFQGQFAFNTPPAESNRDQDWIALWKSLPQLRCLSTNCVSLSSQVSRSLVTHCPRLEKVTQICEWEQEIDIVRNSGWGGILEILRGGNGLRNLQFSQYVNVKFFHRLIQHPTPLLSLLSEGSRSRSGNQSTMVEQNGHILGGEGKEEPRKANEGTGAENMTDTDEEAVHEINNLEIVGPLAHDLRSGTEEDEEDEDEEDLDYVYVDDSDHTGNYEYEGEVVDDEEDEEEQERESIAQCISDDGCLSSLEILRIHRLNLNGPVENHIFRQAIRLLGRLWRLQVSGTGLEKWALLSTEDIGLRCGMDMPKDQFIYPCLREVSFSRIAEDTKDDIGSIVAIMPKLCIFRTIGLNLNYDEIFDIRNNKEVE